MSKKRPEIANSIVAFIDALAWKDEWKERKNSIERGKLIDLVYTFRRVVQSTKDPLCKITTFSDNIVISHTITDSLSTKETLTIIIDVILKLHTEAFDKGIILRGAIAKGEIYHHHDYIVGEGLNRAYEMELKEAKNPRTIIDNELIRDISNEEQKTLRIKKDSDGYHFVDYLRYMQAHGNTGSFYLQKEERGANHIRDLILRNCNDSKCISKWGWLADYFNNTLDNFSADGMQINVDKIIRK